MFHIDNIKCSVLGQPSTFILFAVTQVILMAVTYFIYLQISAIQPIKSFFLKKNFFFERLMYVQFTSCVYGVGTLHSNGLNQELNPF